jgi:putative phosphoesterase
MRVALLADIHANLPALNAVLGDLPPVDAIVCLGDVVGYYADPNEVCDSLRQRDIPSLRGNHDAYVLGQLRPNPSRVAAYRTAWTQQTLRSDNLEWLRSLPVELQLDFGKLQLQLRHATPWNEEEYLYPDSERLKDIHLKQNQCLALGHTHWPLLRQCGEGFVVNPGSVGQPRDCNPAAAYAILDCDSETVEFRRVPYDVAGLQQLLRDLGWDPATIAILSRTSRDQKV